MSNLKSFLIGIALTCLIMVVGFAAVQGRFSLSTLSTQSASKPKQQPALELENELSLQANESYKDNDDTTISNTNSIKSDTDHGFAVAIDYIGDLADAPVKMKVYVKSDGTAGKRYPSIDSDDVADYRLGTRLDVIGGLDEIYDWYAIKDQASKHSDNSQYVENQKHATKDGWITVYVKKEDTGAIEELELTKQRLNSIVYLDKGDEYHQYDNNTILKDGYLIIEPISKSLYDSKRHSAVNFIRKSSNFVEKKRGLLTINLPSSSEKVVLKDNLVDNDGTQEFSYLGHIDELNQHLVLGNYWELYEYMFYDMESGKVTQTFIDYPFISPDQKFIIALYANPYEMVTDVVLYSVKDDGVTPIMSAGFNEWMPTFDNKDIFWSNDGYLYIPVNHTFEVWGEDGNYNDTFQYARIKVEL